MKEGGATGFLWNFHRYRLVKHNYGIVVIIVVYKLIRRCFFTSDAANQKLKFVGQLNKSFGAGGGFTCAFSDVELVKFIQYLKRRDVVVVKKGTVVVGQQDSTGNTWVFGGTLQFDRNGHRIDLEDSR